MSELKSNTVSLATKFNVTPVRPTAVPVALPQCLIVSPSQSRRAMLASGANDAGWDAVVCDDRHGALSEFHRTRFELAMIDVEAYGEGIPDGYRDLCEQLSQESQDLLLAVCGHEGDPMEEIWARQLGVWLYLPGVTDGDDMMSLCSEARRIADELHGRTAQQEVS